MTKDELKAMLIRSTQQERRRKKGEGAASKQRLSIDQLARISRCQKLKAEGKPCNEFTDRS